ncbi:DNA polymerase III subunit beta [Candidatus Pacebacteria bacterium]|nr:DNA polymerase III subunit beta [Candidatus Paceibacterota bacterium]
MHITIDREALYQKLEMVGRVSTKHVTLPVLQCVLLEASDSSLTVKATNLEIGIEATIPAQVEEPGTIAVPATTLIQTINLIHQKEVTLRQEDSTLVVEGATSQTQIKTISYDEFPTIPKLSGEGQKIQNKLFSLGIKTAAFAASPSSIKPELGSIYVFQKKEHSLTFVATDSFRLMEKTVPQQGVIMDESILIPHKNAVELARICDLENSDPICYTNENQFALAFESGVYITSRLTTGSFPDYVQIIPKEYVTHSTLLKNDLAHAFKKTNIFLNKFFQVGMHVTGDSITIHANSGDLGTTTESVPASTEGDDLNLNFNQRYVAEALSHIGSDSIVMHFAGIGRPMVMEGVNDSSLRYLVMPMNK